MLQVDRYSPPPLQSSSHHHTHAPLPQRRERHLEQRGRSRDVSKAALARRRSEERLAALHLQDKALAQARARAVGSYQYRPLATPVTLPRAATSSRTLLASSSDNAPSSSTPGASSSAVKLPSNTAMPSTHSHSPQHSMDSSSAGKPVSSSSCAAVLSHESHLTTDRIHASPAPLSQPAKTPSPPTDLVEEDEQEYTLSEAMQRAYARCQITCPTLAATDSHSCAHMKRARILFLRTKGVEVTSDDDPRIAQVRDEDFVFGDEKSLKFDEECLQSLQEERGKRVGHVGDNQAMTHVLSRVTDVFAWRTDDARMRDEQLQPLEMKSRRHKNVHFGLSDEADKALDDCQLSLFGTEDEDRSRPCRVTFDEVERSLQGSLFPEDTSRSRSRSQEKLCDTLFDTVVWQKGERRARRQDRIVLGASVATLRFEGPRSLGAVSDSTISRTNSWASTVTDASSTSTCITSPSTSPISNKPTLPPLLEDQVFKQQAMGLFKSRKPKTKLTSVPLDESPLVVSNRPQLVRNDTIKPATAKKESPTKAAIVTRVRQSVNSLMDFASRVQQSYLRAVVLQQEYGTPCTSHGTASNSKPSINSDKPLRPTGYRADATDVQRFAPLPSSAPARSLNLTSEHNIPLLPATKSSTAKDPARVFPPLTFVPPSPLRPRNPPCSPEWRLRPISNPCTLRLRALANVLSGEGIVWEGRAHTGSLGCGKERLTGVAFEGLGGSRLAFEAK